mmetsp:Transcript_23369/g.39914  ORF Transcript_23369/g.39914 Transcript_23369/m.39914 type:complete len:111 (+) Transcript_23369:493-825(+)
MMVPNNVALDRLFLSFIHTPHCKARCECQVIDGMFNNISVSSPSPPTQCFQIMMELSYTLDREVTNHQHLCKSMQLQKAKSFSQASQAPKHYPLHLRSDIGESFYGIRQL